jgi:hypothetical protein
MISAEMQARNSLPPLSAGRGSSVGSRDHVVTTETVKGRLASVDLRPSLTALASKVLSLLKATDNSGQASDLLRRITGNASMRQPDYLAIRSGADVTPSFSGGGEVWTWTVDDTEMTFFGSGSPPDAYKGAAIQFGSSASAADRDTLTRLAMVWLDTHLDDRPTSGGRWNRPLIDVTA